MLICQDQSNLDRIYGVAPISDKGNYKDGMYWRKNSGLAGTKSIIEMNVSSTVASHRWAGFMNAYALRLITRG